jgi:hypothetical protein
MYTVCQKLKECALFQAVLDLKRDEFYALPTWKQIQLKQAVGLY